MMKVDKSVRGYIVGATLAMAIMANLATPPASMADSFHEREAKFASGFGYTLYLGLGTALPLLTDGKEGDDHALRVLDALIASGLVTEGLKRVTHEQRPDLSNYASFPSGHASSAFAIATMESAWHPKQAVLWFMGATLIAESRVKLDRHRASDVIFGAGIGFAAAQWELSRPRGLLLSPLIKEDGEVVGVKMTAVF